MKARCLWGIKNALFYVAKEVPTTRARTSSDVTNLSTKEFEQETTKNSPVVGVSMWLAPHPLSKPESWYSYFQSWLLSARQLYANIRYLGRGGLNVKRYWIWKDCQNRAQSDIWTDPRGYYFCNIVAIMPQKQGLGIGKELFQIVTDKADREGMKCYLECSKGYPNVDIYRRFGFEIDRELDCEDGKDVCKVSCSLIYFLLLPFCLERNPPILFSYIKPPTNSVKTQLYCMTRNPKISN